VPEQQDAGATAASAAGFAEQPQPPAWEWK